MKKVLIFQNQLCDIVASNATFPVSPEMVWMDLPDGASAQTHEFNGAAIVLKPPAPLPSYRQLRAAAYPPSTDYLDGIVKGDAAQVQTYVAACLAVKAKYPKP